MSILLLIHCYLKININIITAILLGIILSSNEIYRKKENFQYCNLTNCHQNISNPYFYNPKIMNTIDQSEVPISDGILCRINKNLNKYTQQKNKLNKQYNVINLVKKNITSPDKDYKIQLKSNDLSILIQYQK